jgi:hypothetical protein
LIFIAREGEQVAWISNYLFHLLSTSMFKSVLKFQIYITMKEKAETLPSFLFWRALMLNTVAKLHYKSKNQSENNGGNNDREALNKSEENENPVKIQFGRPCFVKVLREIAKKEENVSFFH